MAYTIEASALEDLERKLKQLSEFAEQYRKLYFGRKLDRQEITRARIVIADIRSQAIAIQQLWGKFIDASPTVHTVLKTLRSFRLGVGAISNLVITLTDIATLGIRVLSNLEKPVWYTLHYQRQCNSLKDGDAGMIQEDAAELQSSVEQVVRCLQNDVDSKQAQIELMSLFAQTVLTGRIGLLTIVMGILAIVIGVVTLVRPG